MNIDTIADWKSQLEILSAEDDVHAQAAVERLQALELQVKVARNEADVAVRMASSSRKALEKTSERLERMLAAAQPEGALSSTVPVRGNVNESGVVRRTPVREVVRLFLQERGEATTREIIEHVRDARPDVNAENTGPELTGWVKEGRIMRSRLGVYRLPMQEAADVKQS
ncbi:hypothetical protein [Streptomyces flavidovirens]